MSKGDSTSSFVGEIKLIVSQLHVLGNTRFDESAIMIKILTNLLDCYNHFAIAWDSVTQDDCKPYQLVLRLLKEQNKLEMFRS
jgi:hypothetical protein